MNKHFRVSGRLRHKLEEAGVPVSAVISRAGLPQDLFAQPRVLVTTEELFALWRAIGEVSSNQAVGLLLGTEAKMEHFSPSALAALSSESFGAAVQQIARYKQLTCPEEIVQEKDNEEWRIQFRWFLASQTNPGSEVLHKRVSQQESCKQEAEPNRRQVPRSYPQLNHPYRPSTLFLLAHAYQCRQIQ